MRSPFLIIGNAHSRRVTLFQEALARLNKPPALVMRWIDMIDGTADLRQSVAEGCIVRIESAGQDFEVQKALLAAGADGSNEHPRYDRISIESLNILEFAKGRILYPQQWYIGFARILLKISHQLQNAPPHRLMQAPGDILKMFNKPVCHATLEHAAISVPSAMGAVRSFSELSVKLKELEWRRVFIKLAHGSSASGVVAYETNGRQHRATTTVEMIRSGGQVLLYNSRRLFIYEDLADIAELIDALCRHRVHIEQWIPKAGIDGKTFDLRVITIAGEPCQVVTRLSHGPMTNLHLLNQRDTADAVQKRMGDDAWEDAMATCRQVAGCFSDSLYCGVDLAIVAGFGRHVVLEVNAFGDLLPGALHQGVDTYTSQILAITADRGKQLQPC